MCLPSGSTEISLFHIIGILVNNINKEEFEYNIRMHIIAV